MITNPNSPLSQKTVQQSYLLAPFPQYTGLGVNNMPLGNSIYHSVIVQLERRFNNGFGILASYTGGKLIDDSGFASTLNAGGATSKQDVYNQKADRSVSAQDISSRFVASVNYELPVGHGRRVAMIERVTVRIIKADLLAMSTLYQPGFAKERARCFRINNTLSNC